MSIAEFLGSGVFRFFAFPVGSAAAGILLRCVTRNDSYAFFKKEDIAVGPQIMLTAALMFVLQSSDRARALIQINQAIAAALVVRSSDNAEIVSLEARAQTMFSAIAYGDLDDRCAHRRIMGHLNDRQTVGMAI